MLISMRCEQLSPLYAFTALTVSSDKRSLRLNVSYVPYCAMSQITNPAYVHRYVYSLKELDLDIAKVNVNGGAM